MLKIVKDRLWSYAFTRTISNPQTVLETAPTSTVSVQLYFCSFWNLCWGHFNFTYNHNKAIQNIESEYKHNPIDHASNRSTDKCSPLMTLQTSLMAISPTQNMKIGLFLKLFRCLSSFLYIDDFSPWLLYPRNFSLSSNRKILVQASAVLIK